MWRVTMGSNPRSRKASSFIFHGNSCPPWTFQLKNSKGDEILFPVNDEQDCRWARRLEWVIEEHLDRAEDDLDKLQADYEAVFRRSEEAHERRYDQQI
jgi:hypothetical protein